MTLRAAVKAVASYLPPGLLTNEHLAGEFGDWDAAKILEKTGIASRHVAAEDECASDLGVEAARRLFDGGACAPTDVDFLLFCTQSPDYFLPTSSCLMQERLGLRTDCGALDFNQGCSGYVYGLSLAKGLVESGAARNVLLVTAETYSKFINPRDRGVRTIFGDGAAATLVAGVESDEELLGPFVFGTDGRGACNLIVPSGGARRPGSARAVAASGGESDEWRGAGDLYMNGPEIFNFTLQSVPRATAALLERGGVAADSVDLFVLHQANKFMLERLRAKMKIPESKFWLDMEGVGNTVSSTIPIALEAARASDRLKPGGRAALVGFGVGYSWAAALMRAI